ncbi:MAG TPA: glycosyltransferase [Vicinamibacterales bacterium]|nr:glycosyltransferase [Vicinamibacterales bacterium]
MGISAIVTAFDRVTALLETLRVLEACDPPPSEIIVHVDGGQQACADAVRASHPAARVMVSAGRVGPGGGRNAMIAAASCPLIASFDDDSRPIDRDYFARAARVVASFPDAAVVGAAVYHQHERIEADTPTATWVADFSGGACIYRKEVFLDTGRYVPLVTAYGMEEVDLGLRLHAAGRRVLHTPWLRVLHDTDLARHSDAEVTAGSVANIALLTYLRYPAAMWPVGAAQCLNRIWWLLGHGRRRGVLAGLARIPSLLQRYRAARDTVSTTALRSYLRLRRHPIPVCTTDALC